EHSLRLQKEADQVAAEVRERVEKVFDGQAEDTQARHLNGAVPSLLGWLNGKISTGVSEESVERLNRDQLRQRLEMAVEDHYRPEIRKMERVLILEILDTAWK